MLVQIQEKESHKSTVPQDTNIKCFENCFWMLNIQNAKLEVRIDQQTSYFAAEEFLIYWVIFMTWLELFRSVQMW